MFILFLHYTVFLIFLGLGIYVLNKAHFMRLHKYAAFLFFNCSIYSLSFLVMSNPDACPQWRSFFTDIGSITNFLISWLLLFTILSYLKKSTLLHSKILKTVFYLSALSSVYFQLSGYLAVSEFYPELPYFKAYYPHKIISGIFQAQFYMVLILAFYLLFRYGIKANDRNKKVQSRLFFFAILFTLIAGVISLYIPAITGIKIPVLVDVFYLVPAGAILYMVRYMEFFEVTPGSLAKSIIELMPPGLILIDSEGNMVTSNQALKIQFGLKKNELSEKKFVLWMNEKFGLRLPAYEELKPFRKQINPDSKPSGDHFYIASFSFITNSLNQKTSAICVFEDITEIKFYEEELKTLNTDLEEKVALRTRELEDSKRKAVESDALKTSFIQNLSHEIRTPLNGIVGFSELLVHENKSEDKKKKYASIITKSSNQLISIVEDVIAVSDLETSTVPVLKADTEIKSVFEALKNNFDEKIKVNVSLCFNNNTGNDSHIIHTDKDKLYLILCKLIDNAVKFSEDGTITVGYTIIQKKIKFYVRDQGIGIEKSLQEKIFDRFWQTEHGATRSYGGIGLGLTISKAYVELLGGELWVESEPGKGAVFSFMLPN